MMSTKKPRSVRFKIEQAITIELTRERFIHAEGLNISDSGLFMVTDTEVEPMTSLYLMLTIPHGDSGNYQIICEGSIARVDRKGNEFHLGVQFTSMEDEDKAELKSYLDNLPAVG